MSLAVIRELSNFYGADSEFVLDPDRYVIV